MAYVMIDDSRLAAIGDAIRSKLGGTETYKPSEMADAINAIAEAAPSQAAALLDGTITTYVDDKLERVGMNAFYECTALTKVDVSAPYLDAYAFYGCSSLSTLILRSKTRCVASAYNNDNTGLNYIITGTAIQRGEGYVYVPKSLVSSYQGKMPWNYVKNQIRAIEDYPEICGG